MRLAHNVSVQLYINRAHDGETVQLCHLSGCAACNDSIMIKNDRTMISGENILTVKDKQITGSVIVEDTWSHSSDHSLLLMLNPQSNYSLVYYVASIEFVDHYLQTLHSNDNNIIHIIALASNTVVRIAPSKDININEIIIHNGEEYISTMNIGDTLTVSSSQDLTGSRVTSNKAISLYSGHYCKPNHADNCSVLVQQIPPFNSWGRKFILHTNISYDSGLIGNRLKIIASDIGANVTLNCTTDGTNYENNSYSLYFREHMIISITHSHCAITSDESILILQFQNSSRHLTDTFMLIIPGLIHYKTYYVINVFNNFSFAAVTVPTENPNLNPLLINNSAHILNWKRIRLNTEIYYYTILSLPTGTYKLAFIGNYIKLGVTIYESSLSNTFALPAGMRLNFTANLPLQGYNLFLVYMCAT